MSLSYEIDKSFDRIIETLEFFKRKKLSIDTKQKNIYNRNMERIKKEKVARIKSESRSIYTLKPTKVKQSGKVYNRKKRSA